MNICVRRAFSTLKSTRVNLKGQGSTPKSKLLRDTYYNSPLVLDIEYIRNYKRRHQELASTTSHPFILRAECHGYALENLTPTIRKGELFVGSKTRYVRGAIPYCNYAARPFVQEFTKEEKDIQDTIAEIGKGGGIGLVSELVKGGDYTQFGKKFAIEKDGYAELKDISKYFVGKCLQDVGDTVWKTSFPNAPYIEKGWKSVLYSAALDSAPDGRVILDYETALKKGLRQIINETKERIQKCEVTVPAQAEKVFFWRSCIRVLEATINWSHKYAEKAAAMAAIETDPVRRKELEAIRDRLRRVPEYPPRDFAEALQSWWMLYVAGHIEGSYFGYSPGRFDRYMYPYYQMEKNLKPDDVLELLEQLRVKLTEMEYVASHSWEGTNKVSLSVGLGSGNLFHNMILGGETRQGASAENDLSMLVLQSAINCKTTAPTLSIWYSNQLSKDFLMKAAEVVKTGVGFPAFFNLNVYVQHELMRNGHKFSIGDIREYAAMGGCTEPVMEGRSHGIEVPGFINHGKLLELALYGGKDPLNGQVFRQTPIPHTLKELVDAYYVHLDEAMLNWQCYWNYVMPAHRSTVGLLYASALTRNCLERGLSLDDGGALNNSTPTTLSSGMVNAVNSFAAVEYMLDNKICSMDELRKALQANWVGYEKLHKIALNAPKWGNDDDAADKYYVDLFDRYCNLALRKTNYLGEKYDPAMLAISTHVPFGKATGATPDGRKKGEQLADGVTSPMPQTDKNGVFAVLKSSQKLDHTRIRGGLLNLKFHPVTLRGNPGSEKLLGLIRTYFQKNAFQLQFNVVDSKVLRDAQKHPEKYRDLIVRVAGFSALFVELGIGLQNEIIARTEHFLGGSDDGFTSTEVHNDTESLVCNIQDFTVQDGPGIRSTIFLQGCPLRCRWCSNPETQPTAPVYLVDPKLCTKCGSCTKLGAKFSEGAKVPDLSEPNKVPEPEDANVCPAGALKVSSKKYSAKELFEAIKKNNDFYQESKGGVTLSGGEPLLHSKFVHEFMTLCRGYGIKLGVETCGQWKLTPTLRDVFEGLDFVYYDMKCFTEGLHKKATGVGNKLILSNLKEVAAEHASKLIVSVPVIPGVNDGEDEFKKMMEYVREVGVTKVRLLPFHPMGASKYEQLGKTYGYSIDTKIPRETLANGRASCSSLHAQYEDAAKEK